MEERQTASPTQNSPTNPDRNSSNGNGKQKIIGLGLGVLILLAAIEAVVWYWNDLRTSVSTDDAVVTGNIADISPKIAGRLEKLYVDQGDVVTAGQELAELDHAELLASMNQAEAALELAQANYDKLPDDVKSAQAAINEAQQGLLAAQAQEKKDALTLGDANRVLNETTSLYDAGAVSKEAFDDDTSAFQKAQASVDADQANIQSAQASLQAAQTQLDSVNHSGAEASLAAVQQAQAAYDSARLTYEDSFIYAPFSGTVIRVPGVVGEYMSPGTPILSIANLQGTWIVANIEGPPMAASAWDRRSMSG